MAFRKFLALLMIAAANACSPASVVAATQDAPNIGFADANLETDRYFAAFSNGNDVLFFETEARPRSFFVFDRKRGRTERFMLPDGLYVDRTDVAFAPGRSLVALVARTDAGAFGNGVNRSGLIVYSPAEREMKYVTAAATDRAYFFPRFSEDGGELYFWSTLEHLAGHFDFKDSLGSDVTFFQLDLPTQKERAVLIRKQHVLDGDAQGCVETDLLPVIFEVPAPYVLQESSAGDSIAIPAAALLVREARCLRGKILGHGWNRKHVMFNVPTEARGIVQISLGATDAEVVATDQPPESAPSNAAHIGVARPGFVAWQDRNRFWLVDQNDRQTVVVLEGGNYPRVASSASEIVEVAPLAEATADLVRLRVWDWDGQLERTFAVPLPSETISITMP